MKYLRKFNENNRTDDMLKVVDFVDKIKKEKDLSHYDEGSSSYIDYNIVNDNCIEIESGWNTYEEGDSVTVNIFMNNDKINVHKTSGGHSVMGGDYDDSEALDFDSVEELLDWLESEI